MHIKVFNYANVRLVFVAIAYLTLCGGNTVIQYNEHIIIEFTLLLLSLHKKLGYYKGQVKHCRSLRVNVELPIRLTDDIIFVRLVPTWKWSL